MYIQVTYNVNGFLDKNNDPLFRDLSQAMFQCEHPLLPQLFPEGSNDVQWRVKIIVWFWSKYILIYSVVIDSRVNVRKRYWLSRSRYDITLKLQRTNVFNSCSYTSKLSSQHQWTSIVEFELISLAAINVLLLYFK